MSRRRRATVYYAQDITVSILTKGKIVADLIKQAVSDLITELI